MIEEALYSLLSGDAAIAAIVGNKIFPLTLPQFSDLPAINFIRIATTGREITHSGTSRTASPIFQINCFATTSLAAKQLVVAVVSKLSGYSGTVGGVKIFFAKVVNEADIFDTELGVFQVAVDVEIVHAE